jgi:hypothetical protein
MLACGSLGLAFFSVWASSTSVAVLAAASAILLASRLERPGSWLGAVGMPLLFAALLRARLAWLPGLPGNMAFWTGLAALVAVCMASQGLLVSQTFVGVHRALLGGQTAWCSFALVTGSAQAPSAFVGLLILLWQQALLRVSLEKLLQRDPPPALSVALLFLGLGGCLGLSAFSGYFQLFIPLMSQGDGVATMQAKLFSGAGLLAAVAMLAVLVQTCAFGYFYWLQVLARAQEEAPRLPWQQRFWPWAILAVSLAWGLHHFPVSRQALEALQAIGLSFPSPSS